MFGKFFSKAVAKNTVKSNYNENEVKELVSETLKAYKSTIFPNGVLSVCQEMKISSDKKVFPAVITITLIMPFACQGELDLIAQTLSDSLFISFKKILL